MISFPNAKINLGLSITGKRTDGFHNIKTLMIPTSFCDVLEFVYSDSDHFSQSGIVISGNSEDNLVMKALSVTRERYKIPKLNIHLHKNIPAGSGLGGGSADAAFMIKMLNDYFNLGMEIQEMQELASLIGSDCGFFINNTPQIASGRGEILESINFQLQEKHLYIFHPQFPISTKEAYANIAINENPTEIKDLICEDLSLWKNSIINDFERKIFKIYPEMADIKNKLYEIGATYVSMSGSGSAIFGIFLNKPEIPVDLQPLLIHSQQFD